MKIDDLIVEKTQTLSEKPLGTLGKLGNKVASAFGSGKAQGRLETGNIANQLRKDFDVYVGKTGQAPTGEIVLGFLKSKGYPTAGAANAIGINDINAPQPAAAPAAAPTPADDQNNVAQPAAAPAQAPATDQTTAAQPEAPAAAPEQPAAQDPNVVDTEKLKPQSGAGNRKAGDMIKVGANTLQWTGTPGQEWFVASGPLSEPNPQTDRFTGVVTANGKRFISADNAKNKLQAETKKIKNRGLFESYLQYFRVIKENLTSAQIDKMIMAAAQEKAATGGSAAPAAASAPMSTAAAMSNVQSAAASFNQGRADPFGTASGNAVGGASGPSTSLLTGIDQQLLKAGVDAVVKGQQVKPEQVEEFKKLLQKL
jgi:hypothetical protein